MTVGQHCNRHLITVTSDASIVQAAQLMREHHVGSLVVVEHSDHKTKPIGILTDRDIVLEVIAAQIPIDSVTIGDIMSTDLLLIAERESLVEATQRMGTRGIRRSPVVDQFGNTVGILTVDDLLMLFSSELGTISQLFDRETQVERALRPS